MWTGVIWVCSIETWNCSFGINKKASRCSRSALQHLHKCTQTNSVPATEDSALLRINSDTDSAVKCMTSSLTGTNRSSLTSALLLINRTLYIHRHRLNTVSSCREREIYSPHLWHPHLGSLAPSCRPPSQYCPCWLLHGGLSSPAEQAGRMLFEVSHKNLSDTLTQTLKWLEQVIYSVTVKRVTTSHHDSGTRNLTMHC